MHLEEALQLLQSAAQPPLAPALVADIQSGLRRLRAPSIQEELLGSSNAATKRNAGELLLRPAAKGLCQHKQCDRNACGSSRDTSPVTASAVVDAAAAGAQLRSSDASAPCAL